MRVSSVSRNLIGGVGGPLGCRTSDVSVSKLLVSRICAPSGAWPVMTEWSFVSAVASSAL